MPTFNDVTCRKESGFHRNIARFSLEKVSFLSLHKTISQGILYQKDRMMHLFLIDPIDSEFNTRSYSSQHVTLAVIPARQFGAEVIAKCDMRAGVITFSEKKRVQIGFATFFAGVVFFSCYIFGIFDESCSLLVSSSEKVEVEEWFAWLDY